MRVNVENTTKKLCIIGDPVVHSKSPLIQNTMLEVLGLDYIYLCQPVPAGGVGPWLLAAKTAGYAGFNATMPHKTDLISLVDEVEEDARRFGAVNTVCIRNGRAIGCNTDGRGFLQSLRHREIDPAGQRVLLLGAGGAARAVALSLAAQGAQVTVCNRTLEKAEELCRADSAHLSPAGFDAATLRQRAAGCTLLVNCTNLGMAGTQGQFASLDFLEALAPGAAVCDLIYHPAQTALLARAGALGHTTLNGLGMLVFQAVFALELFTQTKIDAAAMWPHVTKALAAQVD